MAWGSDGAIVCEAEHTVFLPVLLETGAPGRPLGRRLQTGLVPLHRHAVVERAPGETRSGHPVASECDGPNQTEGDVEDSE